MVLIKINIMINKILFLGALASIISQTKAQTTVFNETFETSTTTFPTGWTTTDINGSGQSWMPDNEPTFTDPMGFSGKVALIIKDTPNDLLATPSIALPTGSLNLTYQIGSYTANGVVPFNCHYAVYVLPSATSYSAAATPVFEESLSAGDIAFTKTIDLTPYAGQNVRIYFRNFDTGLKALILDNVKITQGTLGTKETNNNNQVGIYPNPVTDIINLKSKSKINNVEVYDIAGRKVNVNLHDNQINVEDLQPGNYMITIETTEGKITEKFIKK